MTNRSKAKGTAAEGAVVDYLKAWFPFAERRALHGNTDLGDVINVPGVVIEVKNCARLELAGWVDEAAAEAENAGVDVFLVWHKRKGKASPGDWYVTMPGHVVIELIK